MSNGVKTLQAADNGLTAITTHAAVDEVDNAAGAPGQIVQGRDLYGRHRCDRDDDRQELDVLGRRGHRLGQHPAQYARCCRDASHHHGCGAALRRPRRGDRRPDSRLHRSVGSTVVDINARHGGLYLQPPPPRGRGSRARGRYRSRCRRSACAILGHPDRPLGINISRADRHQLHGDHQRTAPPPRRSAIPSPTTSIDGVPAVTASVKTVDELVTAINAARRAHRQGQGLERQRQTADRERLHRQTSRRRA